MLFQDSKPQQTNLMDCGLYTAINSMMIKHSCKFCIFSSQYFCNRAAFHFCPFQPTLTCKPHIFMKYQTGLLLPCAANGHPRAAWFLCGRDNSSCWTNSRKKKHGLRGKNTTWTTLKTSKFIVFFQGILASKSRITIIGRWILPEHCYF